MGAVPGSLTVTQRRSTGLGRPACPVRGARGNIVETPHPAETLHAYIVFYFHGTKTFHANGRSGPDGPAATRHAVLKGTTPPLSYRHLVLVWKITTRIAGEYSVLNEVSTMIAPLGTDGRQ